MDTACVCAGEARYAGTVFERFTPPALQAVVLARDEARGLRHNYIGTEHLLLGVLGDRPGIAARVLGSLGLTVDGTRREISRLVSAGDDPHAEPLGFTARAKNVVEFAVREASALGHAYVGTEHVLLGLVRVTDSVAARILRDARVDGEYVRNEVLWQVSGSRWV
jgi:ATP-dependent Clp protease ATP-binding subunit ClpC